MTTTTTSSSTPTLPASWVPTAQGCLKTNDFWQWDYGSNDDMRTVLGGPSQTTNCLPSTWDATGTYDGSACPLQYTSACQGTDSNSAITCCPTAFDFECLPATAIATDPHGYWFRCSSQYGKTGAIVVTQTDFIANTQSVATRAMQTGLHLFALAIVYVNETSDTTTASGSITGTSTSTTTITSSSSGTSSASATHSVQPDSQLSAGAYAGIGIGAAAGAILLGLVGWWLLRRRQSRAPREPPVYSSPVGAVAFGHPNTLPPPASELGHYTESRIVTPKPLELSAEPPSELGDYR